MGDESGAIILRRNGAHAERWPEPSVAVLYNHVPGDEEHAELARRFVATYAGYPGGVPHRLIVACQQRMPEKNIGRLFYDHATVVSFRGYEGAGQDIGAYIALAKHLTEDMVVCFGGSAYFQRAGWLVRMVEAWRRHGPGFYGSTSTYEVSPHLHTTAFWCPPKLLAGYPLNVVTTRHRYDFEHGPNALWKSVERMGMPVKLVTWCGEYDFPDWRQPMNLFRRGDQSNCLAYWHHHDKYFAAGAEERRGMEANADTLTDPAYHLGVYRKRRELEQVSRLHFMNSHANFP